MYDKEREVFVYLSKLSKHHQLEWYSKFKRVLPESCAYSGASFQHAHLIYYIDRIQGNVLVKVVSS